MSIAGCAGNGEGLDANGNPIVPGAEMGTPLSADFQSIQENIFTPICSVCHVGGGAPEGLRLDAADSYNLLVGVPSTEVPSQLRVKPGDPSNSYLIQKLQGHAAVGAQMPLGGPYLPTTTIAFIAQWISDGAPVSSSAGATAFAQRSSLALINSVPENGEVLTQSPSLIMLVFSRNLDPLGIEASSARLEQVSEDSMTAARPVAVHVTVIADNPRALALWPTKPLPHGTYRISMVMNDADESVAIAFQIGDPP
jgi:methionine-rich copper-binding protein CopC